MSVDEFEEFWRVHWIACRSCEHKRLNNHPDVFCYKCKARRDILVKERKSRPKIFILINQVLKLNRCSIYISDLVGSFIFKDWYFLKINYYFGNLKAIPPVELEDERQRDNWSLSA